MSQTDSFIKAAKMLDRENRIKDIESEIQCMESCLAQGFTLRNYIDAQKDLIVIFRGLNETA